MRTQVNMEDRNSKRPPMVSPPRLSSCRSFRNPPQPHMCIQDSIKETQEKLFINVMSWKQIALTKNHGDIIPLYGGMQIPQGRSSSSNKVPLTIFAVMVNPDILKVNGKNASDPLERDALVSLLCDFVEAMNPGLKLTRNPVVLKDRDLAGELKDVWLAVQTHRDNEKMHNKKSEIIQKTYHIDGPSTENSDDIQKLEKLYNDGNFTNNYSSYDNYLDYRFQNNMPFQPNNENSQHDDRCQNDYSDSYMEDIDRFYQNYVPEQNNKISDLPDKVYREKDIESQYNKENSENGICGDNKSFNFRRKSSNTKKEVAGKATSFYPVFNSPAASMDSTMMSCDTDVVPSVSDIPVVPSAEINDTTMHDASISNEAHAVGNVLEKLKLNTVHGDCSNTVNFNDLKDKGVMS